MDGIKTQLKHSLQLRLALILILIIALAAGFAGVIGFHSAFADANELQDDTLREIAGLVDTRRLAIGAIDESLRSQVTDPEDRIEIQLLTEQDPPKPKTTGDNVVFPSSLEDGMQTIKIGRKKWRVLVHTLKTGERLAIAQRTAARDEIAEHAARNAVWPLVAILPLALILIVAVLRWMLQPLKRIAGELDLRSVDDMRSVHETDVPLEVRPFVLAINRMLSRVAESMARQRRFVADAAHELRSPLTALSLQVRNLNSFSLPDDAKLQLIELDAGIARSRALLDQLLALARVQMGDAAPDTRISIADAIRLVFEDLIPIADTKGIELAFDGADTEDFRESAMDLVTLLRNLLDNAVRYTQAGGHVWVRCERHPRGVRISVSDDGPGIAEQDQQRVFDPFFRVLGTGQSGSGLGLSIVANILTRLGGTVHIVSGSSKAGPGTDVVVNLPQSQTTIIDKE